MVVGKSRVLTRTLEPVPKGWVDGDVRLRPQGVVSETAWANPTPDSQSGVFRGSTESDVDPHS